MLYHGIYYSEFLDSSRHTFVVYGCKIKDNVAGEWHETNVSAYSQKRVCLWTFESDQKVNGKDTSQPQTNIGRKQRLKSIVYMYEICYNL